MTRGAIAVLGLTVLLAPRPASAVNACGDEVSTCDCGAPNAYPCCLSPDSCADGTCGNCTWHAWHSACCGWGFALAVHPGEGNAKYWNDNAISDGYPTGSTPQSGSIFVVEEGGYGHVGWVVTAHADGSFDSTEQFCCYLGCGTYDRSHSAGYATGGFIYNPGGPGPLVDDSALASETVPPGTQLVAGQAFTKSWTLENTGGTVWSRAAGYALGFDGETSFGAPDETQLASGVTVSPGATTTFEVSMTAPATPGSHRGYFRMAHDGESFGARVSVEIQVAAAEADAAPEPHPGRPDASLVPVGGEGDAWQSGCGCGAAGVPARPASLPASLAALALLLLRRRRADGAAPPARPRSAALTSGRTAEASSEAERP